MFKWRLNPVPFRGFVAAMCLSLLAGCGAGEAADQPAAPSSPGTPAVAVPANLNAVPGNAVVNLTWSAASGASGYKVKRATGSGGPYTQLAVVTAAAYTDSAVINGTTYTYVVSAFDAAADSADSVPAMATPVVPAAPPSAPTALTATPGNAQVNVTWAASSGASSYVVKRSATSGGPYAQIAAVASSPYSDTTVSNGSTYYYVVAAINSQGSSANSTQVMAVLAAVVTIPPVPTGFAATAGNAQVSLRWSASSTATSYRVKRATTSGGPYTQIANPTGLSYVDGSLTNGSTYYYVVSASNSAGESGNAAQVSAMPTAPVANPPPSTFGTWTNVTPAGANLTNALGCGNYGTQSVQVDPKRPSDIYTLFMCQGVWKSTDHGATWTGPINTGTNGAVMGDCAGGITIPPSTSTTVPIIYASCIRGSGIGFWRSIDGGLSWTRYFVAPSGAGRQDYYPPVVDPYDQNHLVMAGHEMDYLVESSDGGQTWTNVPIAAGMHENGGTGAIFFINTGSASSTRGTWLWMAQASGGIYGTWRTSNSGGTWVQVDKTEHSHGASQMYQPDNSGVVFIAGVYSTLGWGVLRSTDYGQTWAHVGIAGGQTVVVGTSKNLYAMGGGPIGIGGVLDPGFAIGAQPGTGTWVKPGTPAGLTQGGAQIAVTNDGTHNILVAATWNSGLWRYIEP